ncbi:unnamed protein product [Paramecium octaurelia]|uniref:Uncharacterized protein n=1 Tax=Paramecium octaurelia TaxID=43137 RepID=A0A8S1UJ78_PAROT|nr:unnamed protein product [Paramecium octaurelia]
MGYFSFAHVTKWKQLYRQSIKKTLQLPQYLPNEELDKIWKQFGFRPSTLLELTLQQANRFQEELKRTQQPIAKLKLLHNANDYWQQLRDLSFDQGPINNEIQKKGEKNFYLQLKIYFLVL